MDCSQFRKYLDNYENLNDLQVKLLYRHAQECEECRCELEFFNSIIKTTASIPVPEMPVDFIEQVNKRIDSEPNKKNFIYKLNITSKKYAAIAACVAVGLVVGLNKTDIMDKLSGNDNSDVIQTTVVTTVSTQEPSLKPEIETETPKESAKPEVTVKPTAEPVMTVKPTDKPEVTVKPTAKPTAKPKATVKPTAKPTAKPKATVKPTAKPTDKPKATVKPTAKPTVKPKETAKSTATLKPTVNPTATPVATAEPTVSPTTEVVVQKENTVYASTEKQNVATQAPVVTSQNKVEATKKDVSVTESDGKNYTLERDDYYVPEQTAAVETVTDKPDVDNYSLATAAPETKYSYKDRTTTTNTSTALADHLIVSAEDVDMVEVVLNELGIAKAHGLYMTQTSVFYEMLARLNDRGITHEYSMKYTTGDKISFKILLK